MGSCDNQAVSFGIGGFESDEGSDVPCSNADTSSIPLSFAIPNLFFVIEDSVVCDFGVFRATVGDEQTMLLTVSSFVDRGVASFLDDGGELIESIDFLCVLSVEK